MISFFQLSSIAMTSFPRVPARAARTISARLLSIAFIAVFVSALAFALAFAPATFAQTTSPTNAQATPQSSTNDPANTAQVVSGVVNEARTGEVVIGVNVLILRDSAASSGAFSKPLGGARTNKYGFYSIPNVPEGAFYLVVRGVGFRPFVQKIVKEGSALRLNVSMEPQSVQSKEVTVEGAREASPTRTISVAQLSTDFVKKMPTLGGEADVFRILQLMPGIKAGSEVSSGLYVRGGSPDQNLVLLDGVTVYNPTHLGGFLSTFNADAIRDVRVIKGAFPAEYGGRLSSVIDLTMKEGSKEKFSGAGNISLIASRLTLEGPITEDVSFMVSGRRTYFDVLLALLPQRPDGNYYFYDLNAKLNWKMGENDRFFLSGYFGRDVAGTTTGGNAQFGVDWGNATANLRWTHILSPSLFTNFSGIFTDYAFTLAIPDSANGFTTLSRIRDFTARGDVQWFPTQEHTVKAGVEATYHQFVTAFSSRNEIATRFIQQAFGSNINGTLPSLEMGIYAQDEWNDALGVDGLALNAGLRLSYFQQGSRLLPEPRLSAVYDMGSNVVGDEFKLKGAFAVANQFLHLVVRNDLTLPTDTWFPATEKILPANSTQYVLGAETTFFGGEVLVSVEGYYKSMRNLLEFKDNASFSLFAPREQDLTVGTGEAYGVELFVNKRIGAFTGWVGYTLSWVTRTFADLNQGKPFFPRYDSRHDISVTFNYKFSDAWEVGAAWVFNSGQAFTMPSGQYFPGTSSFLPGANGPRLQSVSQSLYAIDPNKPRGVGNTQPSQLFTERNGARLPAYHRMDVNFTHYFTWFGLPFNASLSVYNVYNRLNPFTWSIQPNRTTGEREVVQTTLFPIVPTIGIGFKF
jgi:hypothetical protein